MDEQEVSTCSLFELNIASAVFGSGDDVIVFEDEEKDLSPLQDVDDDEDWD